MAKRNTDTVPAMLTPGEFVITDKAVENAGGPGFFYWLMNALDPSSKKPREDGYALGGSVLGSLLSRTQEKDEGPVYPKPDFTIPAGKNILGQTTEEMGAEELTEMITHGGGAPVVGMARKLGRGGIKHITDMHTESIKKALALLGKTGKGGKKIAEDVQIDMLLKKMFKEAPEYTPTKPRIKKQRGGSIDDFSLMDYMMPAMEKRLGPPLKKFQSGGTVPQPGDPNYYQYMQQQGQSGPPPGYNQPINQSTTQDPKYTHYLTTSHAQPPPPSAQGQLIQPSDIYSTGIESIFGEMGLKTPGSEYLENIQAYDPKQQRRMQQDLSRKLPGPIGGAGGFAGSGAAVKKAGEEREMITEQYTSGAEDLRKQYREQIMQDVLADMSAGTYQFEDLG